MAPILDAFATNLKGVGYGVAFYRPIMEGRTKPLLGDVGYFESDGVYVHVANLWKPRDPGTSKVFLSLERR